MLSGCGEVPSKNNKDAAQISQDSTSLSIVLQQELLNSDKPFTTEIVEFSNQTCRIRVTLPEDRRGTGAEEVAKYKCATAAKWLNENGYDITLGGLHVTCWVYSPYTGGVIGSEDLVTQWGRARYSPTSDSIEWTPSK